MKKFIYKAKKGPHQTVEGEVYANSTQEAVDKISKNGYVATFVSEQNIKETKSVIQFSLKALFGVKLKEIIIFTGQLAKLIDAGVPILRALDILSEQTKDAYFKNIVESLTEHVRNGYNLSDGLAFYPKVFSPFYSAMISAGESSGSLSLALKRVAEYYKKRSDIVAKVRMALAYPILILLVGAGTLLFVFTNVIPRILPIIMKLNVDLPLATRILMSISVFLKNNWFWILLWALVFFLALNRAAANKKFEYYFSRLRMGMPLIGEIIMKSEVAQFSRAFAMALNSGISVINAINISIPIMNECGIIDDIKSSVSRLEAGGSFGDALKRTRTFSPFVYNLIKVGEESGNLEDALSNIAESYEADCEEVIKTLTNLLEPAMVLGIGLVVGFIVIAVLLPIFNMNIMVR